MKNSLAHYWGILVATGAVMLTTLLIVALAIAERMTLAFAAGTVLGLSASFPLSYVAVYAIRKIDTRPAPRVRREVSSEEMPRIVPRSANEFASLMHERGAESLELPPIDPRPAREWTLLDGSDMKQP